MFMEISIMLLLKLHASVFFFLYLCLPTSHTCFLPDLRRPLSQSPPNYSVYKFLTLPREVEVH